MSRTRCCFFLLRVLIVCIYIYFFLFLCKKTNTNLTLAIYRKTFKCSYTVEHAWIAWLIFRGTGKSSSVETEIFQSLSLETHLQPSPSAKYLGSVANFTQIIQLSYRKNYVSYFLWMRFHQTERTVTGRLTRSSRKRQRHFLIFLLKYVKYLYILGK